MAAAEEVSYLLLRGGLLRELLPEVERLLKSVFSHLESVFFHTSRLTTSGLSQFKLDLTTSLISFSKSMAW